jgi:FkbM family methyltransferase
MALKELFLHQLLTCAHVIEQDNWDYHLFPQGNPMQFNADQHAAELAYILDHMQQLERVYAAFADDESRETLLSLLLYKSLGPAHVRLPVSTPEYWKAYEGYAKNPAKKDVAFSGFSLNKYHVKEDGLTFLTTPAGMMANYGTDQYFLNSPAAVRPLAGDIVIDGGACWGDTAVRFAHEVGEDGKVFSFEISDENTRILNTNLELNPNQKDRVKLVNNALSDRSGNLVRFHDASVASTLSEDGRAVAETITIDEFLRAETGGRADFIKMDIEGAETDALKGAQHTLSEEAPKLAISVYHRPEDLHVIPTLIRDINPAYQLALRHHTATPYETVLYCWAA